MKLGENKEDKRKIEKLEAENKGTEKLYLSAVKGRRDFREALKKERSKNKELRELLNGISECAMNNEGRVDVSFNLCKKIETILNNK